MKNISPTSFAHSVHFKIPTVCTAGLFHNAHTRRKCSHHLGVIQFLHIRVNDHTVLFWFIKNYHHVNRSETEVSMSSQRDCKLDSTFIGMFKSRRGEGHFVITDRYAFEDFIGIKSKQISLEREVQTLLRWEQVVWNTHCRSRR